MNLGVISDIHAENKSLSAVKAELRSCERIFFLGDLFDRGTQGVVSYLLFKDWIHPNSENIWLSGNHDKAAAWVKNPVLAPENRVYFDSMSPDFQQKCQTLSRGINNSYIFETAQKPIEAKITIDQISFYLTHGFPNTDPLQRLMQYDYRNYPSNGTQFSTFAEKCTHHAKVWLVGHAHSQTAWLFTGGKEKKWVEWIPGFGTDLDGNRRFALSNCEAEIDFNDLPEDSFLILNPGSVGDPKSNEFSDGSRQAEFLSLIVEGSRLHAHFRTINVEKGK